MSDMRNGIDGTAERILVVHQRSEIPPLHVKVEEQA